MPNFPSYRRILGGVRELSAHWLEAIARGAPGLPWRRLRDLVLRGPAAEACAAPCTLQAASSTARSTARAFPRPRRASGGSRRIYRSAYAPQAAPPPVSITARVTLIARHHGRARVHGNSHE